MAKINYAKLTGFKNIRSALATAGKTFNNSPVVKAIGRKIIQKVQSYKKGGRVRKTGLALVHRGEYVIPVRKRRRRSRR